MCVWPWSPCSKQAFLLRADTTSICLFRVFGTCCEGGTSFPFSWLLIQCQDSTPLSGSAKYCHRVALTLAVSTLKRGHRKVMNSLGSVPRAQAEQKARKPAAGLSSSANRAHPPATPAVPQVRSHHKLFILFLANHSPQLRAAPMLFPHTESPTPSFLSFLLLTLA